MQIKGSFFVVKIGELLDDFQLNQKIEGNIPRINQMERLY